MSRGLGRIERKLLEFFEKNRKDPFSTRMLCLHVYPDAKIQKKHRVAVLRGLKRLSRGALPQLWRAVKKGQRDDIWFDYRAWQYPDKPPPTAAPAANKRPRKRRRVVFLGKVWEREPKRKN